MAMNRFLCVVMALMLTISLFGCVKNDSGNTTEPPVVLSHPVVTGTFMQHWAFINYDEARMIQHLQYLKEVGIELLIIQSSFSINENTNQLKVSDINFVGTVLSAAKSVGIKVFIGLGSDDLWWSKLFSDEKWMADYISSNMLAAKTIYDTYKFQYSETFAGWYYWPEYWNMYLDQEQTARGAKFLSDYRDGLYAIDATMPMLMSPYITKAVSPADTESFWKTIISTSTLRPGDIFCCQDSVGAGHINIEQLDAYFAAMKVAADTKPGLLYWANNEDFTPDFKAADMGRFYQQLKITDKYAKTHISFAFCHYRNPDVGKTRQYDAYKYYYENGSLKDGKPAQPTVTIQSRDSGLYVDITASVDNSAGDIHSIVVEKDSQIVATFNLPNSDDIVVECTFTDTNPNLPYCEKGYAVYAVDYSGNASTAYFEKVTVVTFGKEA